MKKLRMVLALVLGLMPLAALAGAPESKDVILKGILVDANCYVKAGYSNDDHDGMLKCGKDCLSSGLPAGLLVGKKLYILVFPGKFFADYIGKTLEISGSLFGDSVLLPKKADVLEKGGRKTLKLKGVAMM